MGSYFWISKLSTHLFQESAKMGQGEGEGAGSGKGNENLVWSIIWFLILWFVGFFVAGFCAGFYILLIIFLPCFPGIKDLTDFLLKGINFTKFCSEHMMKGTPLGDAFKRK